MAKDISAVGASVEIKWSDNSYIKIDEFSDEGTPFDAPDVDVSTNAKNLNGEMISSRTPSVYPFSVTVIPGTIADATLHAKLAKSAIQPGNNTPNDVSDCTVTVTVPTVTQLGESVSTSAGGSVSPAMVFTYTHCRLKSGPTGPTTSAEGRMGARTYQFEAEGFSTNG